MLPTDSQITNLVSGASGGGLVETLGVKSKTEGGLNAGAEGLGVA